jgi:cell division protein FtsN
MSHDFAKQRQPTGTRSRPQRYATRTSELPSQSHWGWFLSGIFCGFLIVGIGYLGLIKLDTAITETAQAPGAASEPANRPTIDYRFYEELANAQVAVPVPETAGEAAAAGAVQGREEPASQDAQTEPAVVAQVEDNVRYLLQAGSFQDRQDAENRRVKILLLNMEASVVPGVVSGRTWYRVQVGPFNGRSVADTARNALSENNIDSIPLLLR